MLVSLLLFTNHKIFEVAFYVYVCAFKNMNVWDTWQLQIGGYFLFDDVFCEERQSIRIFESSHHTVQ